MISSDHHVPAAAGGRGFSRPVAVLVAGAYFMEILDGTIVAPAAPAIAADLGVQPVEINVIMTAYLLTVAVLIPGSGWLADRLGVRTVFTAAMAIFLVASVGCAVAPTLPVLLVARVCQGAGGALMVPVGRLAVLRTSAKSSLMQAIAYLTWPALVAPVLAPTLGGLLSTYASWRWIFLINIPLGAIALIASVKLMPPTRMVNQRSLDWLGLLLTAGTVAALMVGLELVGGGTSAPQVVVIILALAVLGAVTAVRHLLRAREPLLDLTALRIRTLRATVVGGGLFRLVIYAIPFLLPLYFVLGFGWTAAHAGLVIIALFAGNVGIKPLTTPIMRRFGMRTTVLTALAMSAVGLVALAFTHVSMPLPVLLLILVFSGVFRSIGFSAYNSLAFGDVPPEQMSHANTLNAALQELGSGLGVAVGALLLRASTGLSGQATEAGPYRWTFLFLSVILVAPFVEALTLPRSAGSAVTGRR